MNLLFAIDQSCVSLMKTCLHSIVRNGNVDDLNVYVLHRSLSDEHQKELMSCFRQFNWSFITVPAELFAGFPVFKRYPEEIYYRLAASELLPRHLNKILYLDADTVVINPLNSLYETDMNNAIFAGCSNTNDLLTWFNQIRVGVVPDKKTPYLNTGVLLINLQKMREIVSLKDIQMYARSHRWQLWLPDQDIIMALYGRWCVVKDAMIYNLSDRMFMLYNAHPKTEERDLIWVEHNTVVIHYLGRNKPWKKGYQGVLGVFYYQYL